MSSDKKQRSKPKKPSYAPQSVPERSTYSLTNDGFEVVAN